MADHAVLLQWMVRIPLEHNRLCENVPVHIDWISACHGIGFRKNQENPDGAGTKECGIDKRGTSDGVLLFSLAAHGADGLREAIKMSG